MNIEQLKKIFPDATEEQLKKLTALSDSEISPEELQTLRDKAKKFDDSEADKLTNEEKMKKALADAEKSKSENAKILNRTKAESVFAKSGLSEGDYSDLIDGIVSEDEEKTLKLANAIATIVMNKISETETNLKAKQQEETPPPSGGDDSDNEETSVAEKLARKIGKDKSETEKNSRKVFSYYRGQKE